MFDQQGTGIPAKLESDISYLQICIVLMASFGITLKLGNILKISCLFIKELKGMRLMRLFGSFINKTNLVILSLKMLIDFTKYFVLFLLVLILSQLSGYPIENIVEIYGNMKKASCIQCNELFSTSSGITTCVMPKCGNKLKPNCVFYDEQVDRYVNERCKNIINDCDVLLLIGVESLEEQFLYILKSKKVIDLLVTIIMLKSDFRLLK